MTLTSPSSTLPNTRPALLALCALCALLSACGGITVRADASPAPITRNVAAPAAPTAATASAPRPAEQTAAEGLKLARLLRDQGRYDGAAEIYAQLEQRNDLRPLELLEYASVAALARPPQESLAIYGRARRAIQSSGTTLTPAATATLCNGLGRARMSLGQTDAALTDFDCTLAAEPDNVAALNAKGVLLDARSQHEQARQLLTRASELDPSDLRVLNNLALSYLAAGDTAQAIRLLTQAAQSDSALAPTLRLNLAFAQSLQGKDELARGTLTTMMSPSLAQTALNDFSERRQRIRSGSPVAEELLAASRKLLPLREKDGHG